MRLTTTINRREKVVTTCMGTSCHGSVFTTDQTDPWQVVPRQVFTPDDCLLIPVAFVVLCRGGCPWVTSVGDN